MLQSSPIVSIYIPPYLSALVAVGSEIGLLFLLEKTDPFALL